jgi:UDP-glucuronate 4-epimerase
MRILVTGAAGFIGFSVCNKFLDLNHEVVGIDNLNNYYKRKYKLARISYLKKKKKKFIFEKLDCSNSNLFKRLRKYKKFHLVIHLAAEVGVRYSYYFPEKYYNSNVKGFFNILEFIRLNNIKKFIFASSSSVYGESKNKFFSEKNHTSKPMSFYAATKKVDEVMAHSHSACYKIASIGLRFFNVYGPWGRPDMAIYKFVNWLNKKKKIEVYGSGKQLRDFTYIDDAVSLIFKCIKRLNKIRKKRVPFEIFNTGRGQSINVLNLVELISRNLKKKSLLKKLPKQKGDLPYTRSSNKKIKKILKFKSQTNLENGIRLFIDWQKKNIKN